MSIPSAAIVPFPGVALMGSFIPCELIWKGVPSVWQLIGHVIFNHPSLVQQLRVLETGSGW